MKALSFLKQAAAAVARVYFRIGIHLLVTVAGVRGALAPPPTLEMATDTFLRVLWSGCLIVGGLSCMWGLWRLSYRPQIVGSILVGAGIGIYSVVLLGSATGAIAGLLLAAFTQSQITRGVQLRQLDERGAGGVGGGSPADSVLGTAVGGGNSSGVSFGDRDRNSTLAERDDLREEVSERRRHRANPEPRNSGDTVRPDPGPDDQATGPAS